MEGTDSDFNRASEDNPTIDFDGEVNRNPVNYASKFHLAQVDELEEKPNVEGQISKSSGGAVSLNNMGIHSEA